MFTTLSTARRFHVVSFVLAAVCFAAMSLFCQNAVMGQDASGEKTTAAADVGGNSSGAVESVINNLENTDKADVGNSNPNSNTPDDSNQAKDNVQGSQSNIGEPFTIVKLIKALISVLIEFFLYILFGVVVLPFIWYPLLRCFDKKFALQKFANECISLARDENINETLWSRFKRMVSAPITSFMNWITGKPEDDKTFLNRITQDNYSDGNDFNSDWKRVRGIYYKRYLESWYRWFTKAGVIVCILLFIYHYVKYLHIPDYLSNYFLSMFGQS